MRARLITIPLGIATLVSVAAATASVITPAASPAASDTARPAHDCAWDPAVNQLVTGTFRADRVDIRTGPDRSCGSRLPTGRRADTVTLNCYDTGRDGTIWIYYTDHSPAPRTGWSRGAYLAWTAPLDHC